MAGDNKVTRLRPKRRCPNCDAPSDRSYFPFCSRRCSDADLGKWLEGGYTIPVEEQDSGIPQASDEE